MTANATAYWTAGEASMPNRDNKGPVSRLRAGQRDIPGERGLHDAKGREQHPGLGSRESPFGSQMPVEHSPRRH